MATSQLLHWATLESLTQLYNAYRFFNGCKLFLIAIKFVLVDQHADYFLLSDMLLLYSMTVLNGKYGWDKCPKKESHFTSLSNKRNDLINEVRRKTYPWQRLFDVL